ncbi:hypothetical protein Tco_0371795, partial [Tanacetum coccineum]
MAKVCESFQRSSNTYFFTISRPQSLHSPSVFYPGYTPPNLDGYRPTFEHGSTSQIVHGDDLDGDDLDVDGTCDGDGRGSLDGDGSGSLD